MSYRLHREAEDELAEAAEWYERRRARLGFDFLRETNRSFEVLSTTPTVWPRWPDTPVSHDIRRFILVRFPYSVAFMNREEVVVLAVVHAKRKPLYWLDRVT